MQPGQPGEGMDFLWKFGHHSLITLWERNQEWRAMAKPCPINNRSVAQLIQTCMAKQILPMINRKYLKRIEIWPLTMEKNPANQAKQHLTTLCCFQTTINFNCLTLPETNIAPSQKESSLPTIHFQVQNVSFREGKPTHWRFCWYL